MYQVCLFCSRSLGTNERIEHFSIGRRLAFDAARGRLWVVCSACRRWNLTPLEERWEAIEECERLFRGTTVRVSTPNVGLARLADGLELIRIGAPLRPEFAAWRYSQRFSTRFRRTAFVAGAGAAAAGVAGLALGPAVMPALGLGVASILVVPGITTIMGVFPIIGVLAARDYLQHDRVVARIAHGRRRLTVRAKHLDDMEIYAGSADRLTVAIQHDGGWTELHDLAATHATAVILTGANRFGASPSRVEHAIREIEGTGDAASYLRHASTRNGWRGGRVTSLVNGYRGLGAMHLSPVELLALEMAVHEETERRAMDGELATLEQAWRDAEEIARICDEELSPP